MTEMNQSMSAQTKVVIGYSYMIKVPSHIKTASKLMLNLIIARYGGYSEVGRIVGLDRQTLHMACLKGAITLTTVYKVAKALDIDPWALSYVKLYSVFGEKSKTIPEVVDKLFLTTEDADKILKVYRKK